MCFFPPASAFCLCSCALPATFLLFHPHFLLIFPGPCKEEQNLLLPWLTMPGSLQGPSESNLLYRAMDWGHLSLFCLGFSTAMDRRGSGKLPCFLPCKAGGGWRLGNLCLCIQTKMPVRASEQGMNVPGPLLLVQEGTMDIKVSPGITQLLSYHSYTPPRLLRGCKWLTT